MIILSRWRTCKPTLRAHCLRNHCEQPFDFPSSMRELRHAPRDAFDIKSSSFAGKPSAHNERFYNAGRGALKRVKLEIYHNKLRQKYALEPRTTSKNYDVCYLTRHQHNAEVILKRMQKHKNTFTDSFSLDDRGAGRRLVQRIEQLLVVFS